MGERGGAAQKGFSEGKKFLLADVLSTSHGIKEVKKENHITISSSESEKSIKEAKAKEKRNQNKKRHEIITFYFVTFSPCHH
jgi:hypothetical protein